MKPEGLSAPIDFGGRFGKIEQMIKEFLIEKVVKSKLAALPEAERRKLAEAIAKNPELLKKIALEIQAEIKSGKEQMAAVMAVVKKYESELRSIF